MSSVLSASALAACGGGGTSPDGACKPSDPSCNPGPDDAATNSDSHASEPEAAASPESSTTPPSDAALVPDVCKLWVDDAGVTQGCGMGSMGPGDRDDGGDAGPPPPPDASLDASNLGFGASCWDDEQCASNMCFDFKARGTFCSQPCTINADCPSTSPGCNGMGVCRIAAGM